MTTLTARHAGPGVGSVPPVLAVLRARGEESSGRAGLVLATGLSRVRWLGSHLAVAVLGGGLLSRVAALGLAVAGVGSAGTGDTALFGTAIGAAMAYQPAHRVTAGAAGACWRPRSSTPFMRHETEEMLERWAEHRKTLP